MAKNKTTAGVKVKNKTLTKEQKESLDKGLAGYKIYKQSMIALNTPLYKIDVYEDMLAAEKKRKAIKLKIPNKKKRQNKITNILFPKSTKVKLKKKDHSECVITAIKKHLKHHEIKFKKLRNIEIGMKYVDFEYLDKDEIWQELNIFSSMVKNEKKKF